MSTENPLCILVWELVDSATHCTKYSKKYYPQAKTQQTSTAGNHRKQDLICNNYYHPRGG